MNTSVTEDFVAATEETTSAYEQCPPEVAMSEMSLNAILKAASTVTLYVEPSVLGLGIVGNIFAFLVFFKNNDNPTSIFLGALAFSDIVQNLFALPYWVYLNVIRRIDLLTCRVFAVGICTAAVCSTWTITVMSVEKYVAVRFH